MDNRWTGLMWHQVPPERDGCKRPDSDLFDPPVEKVGNRLLSSPVDGEVIGAVRALDRVLAGFGGFHHLASVIEEHWQPAEPEPTKPEPITWWQPLAARLLEHPEVLLGSRERDFLRNMQRSPVPPTNRQVKWLNDIAARRDMRRAS
jgi:hypothetical protein